MLSLTGVDLLARLKARIERLEEGEYLDSSLPNYAIRKFLDVDDSLIELYGILGVPAQREKEVEKR